MPISLHHAQVFYCGVARSAHAKQLSAAGLREYPPGDEAQARDFYGKSLGLEEIRRPDSLSDRQGIWYAAPPGHVLLSADEDLGLHPRRHFALRVDDLDAMRHRFDPFGNKIELDEIPA